MTKVEVDIDQYVQLKLCFEMKETVESEKEYLKKIVAELKEENTKIRKELDVAQQNIIDEKIATETVKIELERVRGDLYRVEGERNILDYEVGLLKSDNEVLRDKCFKLERDAVSSVSRMCLV
ncbi:hypothetical protein EIN_079830 [Entamoeba invadens IP1]|uniref:hypothetical protein n=1 Tax=Entamoeba invadens IP1 TaxID=370355 RepID=UPI0002C3E83A|nr:hypothetical protein EIN_079830 [Entamoeba invadens IP1]ELP85041.1 hypothetical protein EIN_079830 [Entamoeba invadens IP1]|eukprot:XP_004184387.1 hypothetical protein EIN_079830 [Entamoeba invadens IP1]